MESVSKMFNLIQRKFDHVLSIMLKYQDSYTISHMPCLRVALVELEYDCFRSDITCVHEEASICF